MWVRPRHLDWPSRPFPFAPTDHVNANADRPGAGTAQLHRLHEVWKLGGSPAVADLRGRPFPLRHAEPDRIRWGGVWFHREQVLVLDAGVWRVDLSGGDEVAQGQGVQRHGVPRGARALGAIIHVQPVWRS